MYVILIANKNACAHTHITHCIWVCEGGYYSSDRVRFVKDDFVTIVVICAKT